MNIENVKELAKILNSNGLTRIEASEGNVKIVLEKTAIAARVPQAENIPEITRTMVEIGESAVDFNELTEVKSPIVGVFYAAPSPDAMPFVSIGSKVRKGDVLCIIEAMKLLNEITAEQDGEVVDICIKNGDIAEYGQVLFKMT